jgi:hypothetical protein
MFVSIFILHIIKHQHTTIQIYFHFNDE